MRAFKEAVQSSCAKQAHSRVINILAALNKAAFNHQFILDF
jgi:hypothetical protein